jgi:hypothetical protein
LKSSGARWHAHFSKTLHTMGFNPMKFDSDVWIKLKEDGNYADDFLITAKNPEFHMAQLQKVCTIKNPTMPDYYLGANYVGCVGKDWYITVKKCIKESISKIGNASN